MGRDPRDRPLVGVSHDARGSGGILSNTPSEVVFDDNPRRNSLLFSVHLWNPEGEEPSTIRDVLHRHKEIQHYSRAANHILRQQQAHHLRHVIRKLADELPEGVRRRADIRALEGRGCATQMHIVRPLAPSLDTDNHTKDVDFGTEGISARWETGLEDTRKAIAHAPWTGDFDPIEGVLLHQPPREGPMTVDPAEMTSLTRTEGPGAEMAG